MIFGNFYFTFTSLQFSWLLLLKPMHPFLKGPTRLVFAKKIFSRAPGAPVSLGAIIQEKVLYKKPMRQRKKNFQQTIFFATAFKKKFMQKESDVSFCNKNKIMS